MTSSFVPIRADGVATAATITIGNFGTNEPDQDRLHIAFGSGYASCRFSLIPAPGNRGTEIHVTSHELNQKQLKAGLRNYRALIEAGDVLGHEFMGRVVETGSAVTGLAKGDRVVVPFAIACGRCEPCVKGKTSGCANSNPSDGTEALEALYGFGGSALFGYSHMFGGYSGGQAEFVRVPFADFGPIKVLDTLTDEQVLSLSDILPTGYMAAENCDIEPEDVVAIWGCGPVGQMAIRSAFMLVGPCHRDRSLRLSPDESARGRRGDDQSRRRRQRPRSAVRSHRRARPRLRDRLRRHGSARHELRRGHRLR
jgi:hypothetical protein